MNNFGTVDRRTFIRRLGVSFGCFVASASSVTLSGCIQAAARMGKVSNYGFPQGISSADPQPDAVMLWTRAIHKSRPEDSVSLTLQISEDLEFDRIILQKAVMATTKSDHTVRCFVDGLKENRWYFYRFIAPDNTSSMTGRTRTSPREYEEVPLNIAVFSCQNYETGHFNSYRRMMLDDAQVQPTDKIDLCLHLGDFIYEHVNAGAVRVSEERNGKQFYENLDGSQRNVSPLPSGGKERGREGHFLPQTLADYRHIYKVYLSDPQIQAARAWYPFVCIWDDHEVLNDYWQAYHPKGSIQTLKVKGNQAWFEYIPAILTEAPIGPSGRNPARDFRAVSVRDTEPGAFDEDYLSLEPNTQAAVNSMSIYRTLQWGSMADLFLVDGRSYRGPRGLDSSILGEDLIAYPEAPVDSNLIEIMSAGRTASNNNPPESINFEGQEIQNPRKDSPRSTVLGSIQKDWLKESLKSSKSKWRLLGNNLPMMRFGFDTRFRDHGTTSGIYWSDSWDGVPHERRELMDYLLDNEITNVVSLTGDRHANFAGTVNSDYDDESSPPVIPEFVGTSVSAPDRFSIQKFQFRHDKQLLNRTRFDGAKINYYRKDAPSINAWMLYGHLSAMELYHTGSLQKAKASQDSSVNPHLNYADNDAFGHYIVRITGDKMTVEFVVIPMPDRDESHSDPRVRRRVSMEVASWRPGEKPAISNINVDGEPTILGTK